jgi:hypothetical protein
MSIEQMRAWLINYYGGSDNWRAKVNQMPSSQVCAMYFRVSSKSQESQAS